MEHVHTWYALVKAPLGLVVCSGRSYFAMLKVFTDQCGFGVGYPIFGFPGVEEVVAAF